jgi:hypothetical protein
MLYSLILAGDISAKSKVVLTGKMIFENETEINFYLEDHLNRNYTLYLLQKNQNNADFLIEKGIIVSTILKTNFWSKINSCKFKNENDINYLMIDISNEELFKVNRFQVLFLGLKIVLKIERETKSSIIARLE